MGRFFFWIVRHQTVPLRSTSRSRAAVARRAHNPKVGSSNLPFATKEASENGALHFVFTVYVLYSPTFKKIYVGHTSNLGERFKSHNELGKKGWTVKFRPWIICHKEEFATKKEAMKREKELKSAKLREWLWSLISDKIEAGLISA